MKRNNRFQTSLLSEPPARFQRAGLSLVSEAKSRTESPKKPLIPESDSGFSGAGVVEFASALLYIPEAMNKAAVGIIGLSLLILIGGVVIVGSQQSSPRIDTATLSEELAISAADWSKGPEDPKATLVEYSDFQCPACASYFPLLKRAADDFKDDLRLIYRHYPIRQAHKNAELAAQAAEAAGRQGKFWEYHDKLFDFQSLWSEEKDAKEKFIQYARDLGLDEEKFKSDVESNEVKDKVTADYQSGLKLGVNATPTFFLNGTRIQNPTSYEALKSLIQSAID